MKPLLVALALVSCAHLPCESRTELVCHDQNNDVAFPWKYEDGEWHDLGGHVITCFYVK